MKNNDPIYLYILMRTDLASLNMSGGKMCAQASHSANQMVYEAVTLAENGNVSWLNLVDEWERSTGKGFGTCIVLGAKAAQMYKAVEIAREMCLNANITHDPTYPLMDGETLHLIPLDTCAFVFGRKSDASIAVAGLSLHP